MTRAHEAPVTGPTASAPPGGERLTMAVSSADPVARLIGRLVEADVVALAADLWAIDPKLGHGVVEGWAGALVGRVNDLLQEVLHDELTAWRMVHAPFGGADETARVDGAFVDHVTDPTRRWLADRYPEGHRLHRVLVVNWAASARELHTRLVVDRPALEQRFGIPSTAALRAITPGAGDTHRDGRSVACLAFDGSHRVVYKPRSVRAERVLGDLLARTACAVSDPAWPAVRTVERDEYGWMEFVEHAPVVDAAGVQRFYRRAGILLAVAHAIGMNDLHSENLIARGDHPVIIDAETLMPAQVVGRPGEGLDPAAEEQTQTVLDTGLLPRWIPVYRQRIDVDHPPVMQLGGLGPVHHSRLPGLVWEMTDGRPQRKVRALSPPTGANLPVLHGEVQEPEGHRADVLDGFAAACEVFRKNAAAWSAPGGPIAEIWTTPVRVLARNTSAYAAALRAATRRSALRDAAARAVILDGRLGRVAASAGEGLLAAERAALAHCDVPLFVADPSSDRAHPGELTSPAAGEAVVSLTRPPRSASARRLGSVARDADGRHERRQSDLIRAALAMPFARFDTLLTDRGPAIGDEIGSGGSAIHPGAFAAAASQRVAEIADHIVEVAVVRDGRVGWLAVTRDRGTGCTATMPSGWGLADGSLGIALFLTAAARVSGTARWDEVVTTIAETVLTQVRWSLGPDAPADGNPLDLGLDSGYGGLVWALAELSGALDLPELAFEAANLSRLVLERRGSVLGRLDEDGGAAGLVIGLTRLLDSAAAVPAGTLLSSCGEVINHHLTSVSGLGREQVRTGLPDLVRALTAAAAVRSCSSVRKALSAARRLIDRSDVGRSDALDARSTEDDGLRAGTAGRLFRATSAGLVDPLLVHRLDRDVTDLRLVGGGVPTWLVPGLGDGLAGVGWAWCTVLQSRPGPLPWTGLG